MNNTKKAHLYNYINICFLIAPTYFIEFFVIFVKKLTLYENNFY